MSFVSAMMGVVQQQTAPTGGGVGEITHIGGSTNGVANNIADLVLTLPTHAANDIAVVTAFSDNSEIITHTGPTGYTQVFDDDITLAGGRRRRASMWYKRLTSGAESDPIVGASKAEARSAAVDVLRGVSTSTALDVTYDEGFHREVGNENDLPTCKPITTVSANAAVFLFHGQTATAVTAIGVPLTPSGIIAGQSVLGANRNLFTAILEDAEAAGPKIPSAWTHAGGGTTGDYAVYTIAFKAQV